MKLRVILLALLSPSIVQAEYLCKPLDTLKAKVRYCDQNFDYYWAAKACKEEFQSIVSVEQKRIKNDLDLQVKAIADSAQNKDLKESGKVLSETIEDLNYLIDYGKQVHTEIEDYVYELILPIYEGNDTNTDMSNPAVKAEFMKSTCYGDPAAVMDEMQIEIRPVIDDLEKTLEQAKILAKSTGLKEENLGAASEEIAPVKDGSKAAAPAGPPVKKGIRASDVTSRKPLPAAPKKEK